MGKNAADSETGFDGDGPDAHWSAALADGIFLVQQCSQCGVHRFPPALVCAGCGSAALHWVRASGAGTVYSTTTVRSREGDYNVAIVELEERCRIMSRIEGVSPGEVAIGMTVAAEIRKDAEPALVFRPRESSRR